MNISQENWTWDEVTMTFFFKESITWLQVSNCLIWSWKLQWHRNCMNFKSIIAVPLTKIKRFSVCMIHKKGLIIINHEYKHKVCALNSSLSMDICLLSHRLLWKISTLTHKIQKWTCSDLILGMPCSNHFRCS